MKLRGRRTITPAALGVLLCCFLPGCAGGGTCTYIAFSPDGTKVAYVWEDRVVLFPRSYACPLVGLECESEYVFYGDAGAPQSFSSYLFDRGCTIIIPRVDDDTAYALSFSPDSSHVAVISHHSISVIDAKSGVRWGLVPRGERIGYGTFNWLSHQEVAYATGVHESRQSAGPEPVTMTLYRQNIHDPHQRRVAIFSAKYDDYYHPAFNWSPDLKYIFLSGGTYSGPPRLLEVPTGRISPPLVPIDEYISAAWKPDSSALLFDYQPPVSPRQVKLVHPQTRHVKDLTQKFHTEFGHGHFDVLTWTADGDYVQVNTRDAGTCLVRLEPWELIPFEQRHDRKLPKEPGFIRRIRPHLVPGWLRVYPGKGAVFAVDYKGRHVIPLTSAYQWAISRDGKRIAEATSSGRIRVRELMLPPLRQAPAEALKRIQGKEKQPATGAAQ